FIEAQDEGVCHDDRVNGDIHLMTVQVSRESGTEKAMTRSLHIKEEARHLSSGVNALNLCRYRLEAVKPEIKCRQIVRCAGSIDGRSTQKTMGSPDIPEGADELPRVRNAMELGRGRAGTLYGYDDPLGGPRQSHVHQWYKTQQDEARQT